MRVVPNWKEINRVLRVVITSAFIGFLAALIFIACNDEYYFGKSREDLAREMFEVDSLIMAIQKDLDSTSIDFKKFYIDAQRINNGHN
jgi:phosphate/sulfate permease